MDFWGFERRFSDFPGERFGFFMAGTGSAVPGGSSTKPTSFDAYKEKVDPYVSMSVQVGATALADEIGKTDPKSADPAKVKTLLTDGETWIKDEEAKPSLTDSENQKLETVRQRYNTLKNFYDQRVADQKAASLSATEQEAYFSERVRNREGELKTQSGEGDVKAPPSTGNPDADEINKMVGTGQALSNLAAVTGLGINQWSGAMGIPNNFSTSVNYPGGSFGYGYNRVGSPFGGGPFVQTGSFSQPGVGFGGGGPGSGFGGFDVLFDIGPAFRSGNLTDDIKRDNRRLEALIAFLIAQILAGNTDAITTALIVISRKSKGTLILSAHAMMTAMQQYDKQQEVLTEKFKQLDPNQLGQAEFNKQSQTLGLELNSIATSRQMFMNQLRDVMTMSEEIGNVEKSILDITGQFKRHYSRFNV